MPGIQSLTLPTDSDYQTHTAARDINDLVDRGVLRKDGAGGRSTSYSLPQ